MFLLFKSLQCLFCSFLLFLILFIILLFWNENFNKTKQRIKWETYQKIIIKTIKLNDIYIYKSRIRTTLTLKIIMQVCIRCKMHIIHFISLFLLVLLLFRILYVKYNESTVVTEPHGLRFKQSQTQRYTNKQFVANPKSALMIF